jgi:hypothetical protein
MIPIGPVAGPKIGAYLDRKRLADWSLTEDLLQRFRLREMGLRVEIEL